MYWFPPSPLANDPCIDKITLQEEEVFVTMTVPPCASSHTRITVAFPHRTSEPHLSHSEGEGSGPPDWGTSPYGPVTGSRSSFLGCHCSEETMRGRFFSGLFTDYSNSAKLAWILQKFKSKTLNRTKQITLTNVFPSCWVYCKTAKKSLQSLKQQFDFTGHWAVVFYSVDCFLRIMSSPKRENITSLSIFFPSESGSLRASAVYAKGPGIGLCNKDRLESSRRQREEDLQLQLK